MNKTRKDRTPISLRLGFTIQLKEPIMHKNGTCDIESFFQKTTPSIRSITIADRKGHIKQLELKNASIQHKIYGSMLHSAIIKADDVSVVDGETILEDLGYMDVLWVTVDNLLLPEEQPGLITIDYARLENDIWTCDIRHERVKMLLPQMHGRERKEAGCETDTL